MSPNLNSNRRPNSKAKFRIKFRKVDTTQSKQEAPKFTTNPVLNGNKKKKILAYLTTKNKKSPKKGK